MMKEKENVEEAAGRSGDSKMNEDEIDETLMETFPASDPPSWTLGTDHREEPAGEQNDLGSTDEPSVNRG